MSSFETLERYNEYSNELIHDKPSVRIAGVKHIVRLLWDAPELKLSIVSKLEQAANDTDEAVARLGKRMLEQIKSGRGYDPYSPYRRATPSSSSSEGTRKAEPAQNVKNIVINVVCCIVFIIIYFLIYGVF